MAHRWIRVGMVAALATAVAGLLAGCPQPFKPRPVAEKPVIYLYPEQATQVRVEPRYTGTVDFSYPQLDAAHGWDALAQPGGTLEVDGHTYPSLFWEGHGAPAAFDMSSGWSSSGSQAAGVLASIAQDAGLDARESAEFVQYWGPRMARHPHVVIHALTAQEVQAISALAITPEPDTLIRLYIAWYPTTAAVTLTPQHLTAPGRDGFVAVEWGGMEVQAP